MSGDTPELERRFEDFYCFEYPRLVAALRLVVGDDDLARDAVDDACAKAWERLRRGKEIEVLGAWVRVVALNGARGRLRRNAWERKACARLEQRAIPTANESAASLADAIDVRAALARLPRRSREIVVCFYFLDDDVRTIATTFGVPEGTVKTTLHRARALLADILAERPSRSQEEQAWLS